MKRFGITLDGPISSWYETYNRAMTGIINFERFGEYLSI